MVRKDWTYVLSAGEPTLLFANRHDVRQLHLYTGRYQLIYGGMHAASAVDYDISANAVFWTDVTSKNISRLTAIHYDVSTVSQRFHNVFTIFVLKYSAITLMTFLIKHVSQSSTNPAYYHQLLSRKLQFEISLKVMCQGHMQTIVVWLYHYHHILFPSQYRNNKYSAVTHRIIEMVGCQKSKCSSSWPPIITFIFIVNIQTFIPTFTQTHSIPMVTQTNGNADK